MVSSQFDVIIVGAGAAGLAAAIGLAKGGFRVVVVEAAPFPGAENWSGCVYFCENLANPELLGPDGVEALAWERRLVERGFFATDGYGLLGATYRDPAAFRHCYTVLRPIFDHHLAQLALRHGAALLTSTTAESLIRDRGRVVGVCTHRGPLYADLVFLAEGDASHLVTREGYERTGTQNPTPLPPPRSGEGEQKALSPLPASGRGAGGRGENMPKFLQGIKQVIDLPPGAIESAFNVGPEEGVAYEMLVRNATLRGREVKLNMGGFVYANRQSLSVGLVLPADNLAEHFGGDPNLLLEWFEAMPSLRPWLKDGKRGVFGAKIIRGGGAKDIPHLIDDGLAIGGAASAIGIDFPYPNFTGPATYMGLLLARAVKAIRKAGGDFTKDNLERHYLIPLRHSHYWQDVEYLRRWPDYVKKTSVFFGRNIDLALTSAHIWTRPGTSFRNGWKRWSQKLQSLSASNGLAHLKSDAAQMAVALRLPEVANRPPLWRMILDGFLNTVRDLLGRPRGSLSQSGQMRLHYTLDGIADGHVVPATLSRWFERFRPALEAAARRVYTNDSEPLSRKMPGAIGYLFRQFSYFDFFRAAGLALTTTLGRLFGRKSAQLESPDTEYAAAARLATDLTPLAAPAAQAWEARLADLAYETVKESHIRVLWPDDLAAKQNVTGEGLWHVCPAHVYEARVNPAGQLQVVVNFENCIKCETCWRTSDRVDWARDGRHRFIYTVTSPAVAKVLDAAEEAGAAAPLPPHATDPWAHVRAASVSERAGIGPLANPRGSDLARLLNRLERKLNEFDGAMEREPRTLDRNRAAHLELLARHAQHMADEAHHEIARLGRPEATELARQTAALADERTKRTWQRRFAWAAADGRQLVMHHLAGLRRLLGLTTAPPATPDPALAAETASAEVADRLNEWRGKLDAVFAPMAWRDIDRGTPLSAEQDTTLLPLLAEIPSLAVPACVTHPLRRALLAELGRRDPSLAFRAACHLWARDFASLFGLTAEAEKWTRSDEWACLARDGSLAPAASADSILVIGDSRLHVISRSSPDVLVEPLATLGLRGAGIARVTLASQSGIDADPVRLERTWTVLTGADLVSIAFGMADVLCQRAVAHATSRVQFPGLFHDEQSRDPIGKFGAVKRMVAEIAARRYLLETLDHVLAPRGLDEADARLALLIKATAAEALGETPGSVAYNAVQVFGGTGFSEDDILSKYYRDAAAWRFLGVPNAALASGGCQPPGGATGGIPSALDLSNVERRGVLRSELDIVRSMEAKLADLTPVDNAEMTEELARQEGKLLATRALLARTHARMEEGIPSETEAALLNCWLDDTAASLDAAVMRSRRLRTDLQQPSVAPAASPPVILYSDYLKTPSPYDSGDFLLRPPDLHSPRAVPELVETDPELAAANREFLDAMEYFAKPRADGLIYERHIERAHRPSDADLDFLRERGFFRQLVPREQGGASRRKLDYYLLIINTQRHADTGVSLTIQVNSSLGTTPILVARVKDLPKAQQELSPFVADTSLQQEVRSGLDNLLSLFTTPSPGAIQAAYLGLNKRLTEAVLSKTALRVLSSRFVEAWSVAGRCGVEFDLPGMQRNLEAARSHWTDACSRAGEYHREMARRREACDLALRWIALGWISGFALTEPSAGSDTARVATRARPRSVPVQRDQDWVLSFVPFGSQETRHLLDARRIEFRSDAVHYRFADGHEPAKLHYEDYDYETDDPAWSPWYMHGERRVSFTDIAQLRERDGQLWYDYWELTGAKMWITNGRMCGLLCLYARTDEGVTGFIVDRHAEGLLVGKDEEKMGQCGSPTNELSLQAVRVPRENVLGLEGRGQVNALETLNVGRAGLAMSAMAQMKGLVEMSRAFSASLPRERGESAAWRIARMEEERFTSESLAFDVIGRFEHKETKSVRLESAIAKMFVSESLHRVIDLAEEVYGLEGQTQEHLVEKRRRDARVLNIYEGTNEIQRFFILRDLGSDVAPRWARLAADTPLSSMPEMDAARVALRLRVEAALQVFGPSLWSNPNLQADCFLLSEAAAWYKAAESTLGRLAWLRRRDPAVECDVGRRALARCIDEVNLRLRRFDDVLARLRRGFYAPHVHAAELLFEADQAHAQPVSVATTIERPLSVLVVVEPGPAAVPQPHVNAGLLFEPYRELSPADQAAVEIALRLRDAAPDRVHLQAAAVGPRSLAVPLRELLSWGIDPVHLVETGRQAVSPDTAARALAAVLENEGPFDLVLGGDGGDLEEGLLARLTAARLGIAEAGRASELAVRATPDDDVLRLTPSSGAGALVRSLPAFVAVEAGLTARAFTTGGYLAGLSRAVRSHPWPESIPSRVVHLVEETSTSSVQTDGLTRPLSPNEAARQVLESAGVGGLAASVPPFEGPMTDVPSLSVPTLGIIAILAPGSTGDLSNNGATVLRTAAGLSAANKSPLTALLLTPDAEPSQRRAISQARALAPANVVVLPTSMPGDEVHRRLLVACWSSLAVSPLAIVSEAWAAGALAALGRDGTIALRVRRAERAGSYLFLGTLRARGKLRSRQSLALPLSSTLWLSLAEDAEATGDWPSTPMTSGSVQRWAPKLDAFYGREDVARLLEEVRRAAGVPRLTDAEFILDVGFGVANRDGYEAVIQPLEEALRAAGVTRLAVGGSRKVTEEMKILPADRQIGQSGVTVNPRILLAIGVSGAPQHLNYIGPAATILAFNRDPEAPIMTLNQRQARPRVFPVLGDLFETVPALTAALRQANGDNQ